MKVLTAMSNLLDDWFHQFSCENPHCGNTFTKSLRWLDQANEVICPTCGRTIDIREAKRHGQLGKDINAATQIDIKTRQKK